MDSANIRQIHKKKHVLSESEEVSKYNHVGQARPQMFPWMCKFN